jgi:DNA repair protein RecO (recombination protein O)
MTLLSADHGKFAAVAKGARGPKSKLGAVSQLFVLGRFLIAPGRSLHIATQVEIEALHGHISGDLLRTAWASYLCELCDVMPELQPDEELFALLTATLDALDDANASAERVNFIGHWFEARFLALAGYAPAIGRCVACGEKIVVPSGDDAQKLAFSPARGGNLCQACVSQDPQRLTTSAGALRALHMLERMSLPPTENVFTLTTAARRELRDCLRRSVVAHLDIRLKSQKFLDEVQSLE